MKRCVATSRAQLAALIAVATFSACGADGGHAGTAPVVSFDGQWEGTWTASSASAVEGPSGGLTLQLDQSGTTVTGTATFTGHPCLTTCSVSCQVDGHGISGRFHAGTLQVQFSGFCPESNHCTGAHHANILMANYGIHDGPCSGESGSMQMTPISLNESSVAEERDVHVGEVILIDTAAGDAVRLPVFERTKGAR